MHPITPLSHTPIPLAPSHPRAVSCTLVHPVACARPPRQVMSCHPPSPLIHPHTISAIHPTSSVSPVLPTLSPPLHADYGVCVHPSRAVSPILTSHTPHATSPLHTCPPHLISLTLTPSRAPTHPHHAVLPILPPLLYVHVPIPFTLSCPPSCPPHTITCISPPLLHSPIPLSSCAVSPGTLTPHLPLPARLPCPPCYSTLQTCHTISPTLPPLLHGHTHIPLTPSCPPSPLAHLTSPPHAPALLAHLSTPRAHPHTVSPSHTPSCTFVHPAIPPLHTRLSPSCLVHCVSSLCLIIDISLCSLPYQTSSYSPVTCLFTMYLIYIVCGIVPHSASFKGYLWQEFPQSTTKVPEVKKVVARSRPSRVVIIGLSVMIGRIG